MSTFPPTSLRQGARLLARQLRRASKVETAVLLLVGLLAAAVFAFGTLAEEVFEGDTTGFDRFVLLAFRNPANLSDPIGPAWLEETMRDFTALGGVGVLTAITLTVIGFLVLVRKRHVAAMVAASVGGGTLLSNLLKWGFSRPRPELVPHFTVVYTHSFPSGHAMLSAVVYLTLGALLARTQASPRVKAYLLGIAACTTVVVGVSRVYLGVHWPTDVLAGWALGAGWAMLCWLVMLWLQSRGKIEPESATSDAE